MKSKSRIGVGILLSVALGALCSLFALRTRAGQDSGVITWNFESGNLQGWTKSGDAFDQQPTYGNNVSARRPGTVINYEGNYWIGTYERRPNQGIPEGTTQGDEKTGTLTSNPFIIAGSSLSFLIGGGNDINRLRVELLVKLDSEEARPGILGLGQRVTMPDGTYTVELFVTGRNDELMRRDRFDLSRYLNKTARIRIVDNSDRPWGHINVDDFQLDSRMCNDCDGDGHNSIAAGGDDCDDNDPNRYPGRAEVCDTGGHDEDCDPETYGVKDLDRDGFSDASCFNRFPDGRISRGEDCNDSNRSVHPLATEICDGIDNNCNGQIDEGVMLKLYADNDGDGFGSAATLSVMACHPGRYVNNGKTYSLVFTDTDCDDNNPLVHPGQFELRDGIDNNCNGVIDEEPIIPKPQEQVGEMTRVNKMFWDWVRVGRYWSPLRGLTD